MKLSSSEIYEKIPYKIVFLNPTSMKNTFGFLILFFFIAISALNGQTVPNYPIPSFNITVDGYANFANLHSNTGDNVLGKRQVNVHCKSSAKSSPVKL